MNIYIMVGLVTAIIDQWIDSEEEILYSLMYGIIWPIYLYALIRNVLKRI